MLSIKLETFYIIINTIVNSDKMSNIKNKIICQCDNNANSNFNGALC